MSGLEKQIMVQVRVGLVCLCMAYSVHCAVVATPAGYGDACTLTSECTQDPNTYCKPDDVSTCSMGTCACLPYMKWDSGDQKCKVMKYYDDRCNSTLTMCQGGTSCTANVDGRCDCSGSNVYYNTILEMCIVGASAPVAVGENCNDVTGCYSAISGSVKCAIPTGSTGTQKKCECESGYVADGGQCRKPHIGETSCTSSVQCAMSLTVTDSSLVDEECNTAAATSICVCPSGSHSLTFYVDGRSHTLCMNDYTGTQKSNGDVCTASNECSSEICTQCPGETSYTCLQSTA